MTSSTINSDSDTNTDELRAEISRIMQRINRTPGNPAKCDIEAICRILKQLPVAPPDKYYLERLWMKMRKRPLPDRGYTNSNYWNKSLEEVRYCEFVEHIDLKIEQHKQLSIEQRRIPHEIFTTSLPGTGTSSISMKPAWTLIRLAACFFFNKALWKRWRAYRMSLKPPNAESKLKNIFNRVFNAIVLTVRKASKKIANVKRSLSHASEEETSEILEELRRSRDEIAKLRQSHAAALAQERSRTDVLERELENLRRELSRKKNKNV